MWTPVAATVTAAKSSHWYPMIFCGQLGQPAYLHATCCAGVTLTQCHLSIQILVLRQVVFFRFQHTRSITCVVLDGPVLCNLTSLPSGERSTHNRVSEHFFFFMEIKWDLHSTLQVATKPKKGKLPGYLVAYNVNQVVWSENRFSVLCAHTSFKKAHSESGLCTC